jgi:hypothetical protein
MGCKPCQSDIQAFGGSAIALKPIPESAIAFVFAIVGDCFGADPEECDPIVKIID